MAVKALKAQLRKQAEAVRASLSETERAENSALICKKAVRFLEDRLSFARGRSCTLFSYVPFRTELDVTPVMEWCWELGGTVVVPKVIRDKKLMSLHVIRGNEDLETGKWGIREPLMSAPVWRRAADIDVMLVPGLAFDSMGGRLGYGGGYYDAFIRRCRENVGKEPFKLALAFDAQIVPEVPMDNHDFRVDAVLTENRQWILPQA
ncbi:5-formyltetrahydrofolate cyclo-ligase [Paenibacillus hemerocallicola]|uniref:5-formyltetrahydrofolate cyclo-ligase n=1 Tax=Paenibacillus hemerocallicola TaxID=1172614 RepID=A0A5C4TCG6_9BACL|nr:5-formyltetrahydrofolate cyclo-ligase [Paenibacillus hemerocallicola]TNJ66768.1 5-formyltetrahydrofolate cyclo-ligase [Paenibacillus hemerocallicola]